MTAALTTPSLTMRIPSNSKPSATACRPTTTAEMAAKTTITGSKIRPMVMAVILSGRFMQVHLSVYGRLDEHNALFSKIDDRSERLCPVEHSPESVDFPRYVDFP